MDRRSCNIQTFTLHGDQQCDFGHITDYPAQSCRDSWARNPVPLQPQRKIGQKIYPPSVFERREYSSLRNSSKLIYNLGGMAPILILRTKPLIHSAEEQRSVTGTQLPD